MSDQEQIIKLELTLDQINMILETLGERPFAQVYQLINSIQRQAQGQLQEPAGPAEGAG